MHALLQGLAFGVAAALLVLYAYRPKAAYPRWMLLPADHPWLLPLLAVAWYYVFLWDARVGLMLAVLAAAVAADLHELGRGDALGR